MELLINRDLPGFTLQVDAVFQSRRVGILGASGCGKSMTLQSIAGICRPDSGRIVMDGRTLFDSKLKLDLKPQKRRVGYLFQSYALFPCMTVEENIASGFQRGQGGQKDRREKLGKLLAQFQLLGLERRYPRELSGGQQQRTALARMMANEPEVILLDEPFSALDMYLRDQLQHELERFLETYEGTAVLVSHNRDEIYRFCRELMVMDQGRQVQAGDTREIFHNPGCLEAARLTGCKNISPAVRLGEHCLRAVFWGIELHTEKKVPKNLRYVGFRAHEFLPRETAGGPNRMPVRLCSQVELPFETQCYLRPETAPWTPLDAPELCWFIQREDWRRLYSNGLPPFVEFPAKKLLLLE